jgi:putative multiple sugar transport system substrate-binding protein
MQNKVFRALLLIVAVAMMAGMVVGCAAPAAAPAAASAAEGDAAATTEAATEAAAEAAPAASGAPQVGIVLPTKDEPRWIQDEARFNELLATAGVPVEILFSQGDSAKEKANVESLLTKGIQVLILTPQDGAAAAAAAEAARDAGVKVIAYDRLILGRRLLCDVRQRRRG